MLALVVGVGGFVWPGFFKQDKGAAGADGAISQAFARKATPEEYYRAVETNSADSLAQHLATAYDNLLLSAAATDDVSVAGSIKLAPGDKAREMLTDSFGSLVEGVNPGEDFQWFKSISAVYDLSRKGDLLGLDVGVQLNDTDLLHANGTLRSGDSLCISIPELSERYLSIPMEYVDLDAMMGRVNLGAMFGSAAEDPETMQRILKALPDAATVETLLRTYLTEAVAQIETVSRSDGTLSVADVSADYTVLTATIDPETAVKIVQALGPKLKEDKDIQKLIQDIAAAAQQDGSAKYKEFTDKIDELLGDPDKIRQDMKNDIVITVYLDKKTSEVCARIVDTGARKFELAMPEAEGRFGLMLRVTDDGKETFQLIGSGKRSGDLLTGDLDLQVKDEYYGVIGLDGFDIEKAKDGLLVGGVDLKPSASVWKLLETSGSALPESAKSVLDSLTFHLDLDSSKEKSSAVVTVSAGSGTLLTISFEGSRSAAKKIAPAEGVEPADWAGDITLEKLEKVVDSLEKAGVPAAYTEMLDAALGRVFG